MDDEGMQYGVADEVNSLSISNGISYLHNYNRPYMPRGLILGRSQFTSGGFGQVVTKLLELAPNSGELG
jgi:hypothetical protein